jgi:chemotaxis protein methyltransferase CheR
MSKETEKCIHFLKEKYALDISIYDSTFLEKGVNFRMEVSFCKTIDDYILQLDHLPMELYELLGQLTNSCSEFFRNPLTFAYLEQIVLPSLISQKEKNQEKEIRIWSAACASGQEAYSLAILCDELIEAKKTNIGCRIFATDISQEELVKAKMGVFQSAAVSKVSLKRIQAYFTQIGETYTILSLLRNHIDFSIFDLLAEDGTCPPASIYGNFDLVFCSNLLFYYKPEYQQRILDKAMHCLASGGFLITGETEREIVKENNYCEVFANSGIFKKNKT